MVPGDGMPETAAIERAILRELAFAPPVSTALERICALVEERTHGALCAVMIFDAEGELRVVAAPSIPREQWATLPPAAEEGPRSCRSQPIIVAGEELGAVAILRTAVGGIAGSAVSIEPGLIATAAELSGMAIECDRARRSRERLERALIDGPRLEALARRAGEVAHDVGNQLTVILAATDALRGAERSPDPAAVRELAAGQIRGAGRRASELLRELSRRGRAGAREERAIDPIGAIAAIEPMLRRLLHERIRWRLVLPESHPELAADPVELQRLAMTLVAHAAEALPRGGDLALALVAGAGPDGAQRSIVEVRASRADPGAPTEGDAASPDRTSLRKAAEHLGGQIDVEGDSGGEMLIRATLPARTAANGAPRERTAPPASATTIHPAAVPAARGAAPVRARVLLCEDDALVRSLLAETMRSAGFAVAEAATGADALERSSCEEPDLLVCDVVMPGIDGPTLLGRLRAARPGLPCILISGHPRDVIERSFARRGATPAVPGTVAFLEKPFTPSELLAAVEGALADGAATRGNSTHGTSGEGAVRMAQRSDPGAPGTDR